MIVKPYDAATHSRNARERAGAAAEQQMAHYLHRKFERDPEVCVLHQLRVEDADQPEQNGSAGVCQVDHLVVHRWGFFLVESKSVTEAVQIRSDGDGDDEWSRTYLGVQKGMPSPIRQARRQSEFLRTILERYRTALLGRTRFGERTIAKLLSGTDQRGFRNAPMQLVIAVSDGSSIRRLDGWKEPRKPFRVFVTKADLVTKKIDAELDRHRTGANLLDVRLVGEYGLWRMEAEEVRQVAEFLAGCHKDRSAGSLMLSKPTARRRDAAAEQHGLKKEQQTPNAYEAWRREDDSELWQLHEAGWDVPKLANRFGRTRNAIKLRLKKLEKR